MPHYFCPVINAQDSGGCGMWINQPYISKRPLQKSMSFCAEKGGPETLPEFLRSDPLSLQLERMQMSQEREVSCPTHKIVNSSETNGPLTSIHGKSSQCTVSKKIPKSMALSFHL